ncbi:type II secretion system protein [Sphaerospermopsis sp. LEGE 00249]|uniref:type IV pilus modification PilV family protein n=1 Tax=Sphaerospermopsis sp. LEGE 00249 TaxID=1380707 RepID=UPI00164E75EE|nr:type II secretion system protein [Sphaerospermopsis sp. LEGE 00249]MBC5795525.1 type II secretion system protein [Sphaerospermopsis sp. LEGE 00249]
MNKPRFDPDSGFSLLEVLAAILIVTFFTTVAMQMLVISTAFKARAKEYATAANLIQQDLENIRSLASEFQFPTASPTPTVGATTVTVLPVNNGLATGDKVQFEKSPYIYTISVSGSTVTITPALIEALATPTVRLVSNTVCNPPSPSPTPSPTTGLAQKLRLNTQGNLGSVTATYAGLTYTSVNNYAPYTIPGTQMRLWLMRNDTNSVNYPYDVLQVKYIVAGPEPRPTSSFYGTLNTNAPKIVAELTSEVIPNASFQCIR